MPAHALLEITIDAPHFEGKGSIADFLQALDERVVVEPPLARRARRQASISSDWHG
jgi:hypothetical protein